MKPPAESTPAPTPEYCGCSKPTHYKGEMPGCINAPAAPVKVPDWAVKLTKILDAEFVLSFRAGGNVASNYDIADYLARHAPVPAPAVPPSEKESVHDMTTAEFPAWFLSTKTLPQKGQFFLAFAAHLGAYIGGPTIEICRWEGDLWSEGGTELAERQGPFHWMPLPQPPTQGLSSHNPESASSSAPAVAAGVREKVSDTLHYYASEINGANFSDRVKATKLAIDELLALLPTPADGEDARRLDWLASRATTELVHYAIGGWSMRKVGIAHADLLAEKNIHDLRQAIDAARAASADGGKKL